MTPSVPEQLEQRNLESSKYSVSFFRCLFPAPLFIFIYYFASRSGLGKSPLLHIILSVKYKSPCLLRPCEGVKGDLGLSVYHIFQLFVLFTSFNSYFSKSQYVISFYIDLVQTLRQGIQIVRT